MMNEVFMEENKKRQFESLITDYAQGRRNAVSRGLESYWLTSVHEALSMPRWHSLTLVICPPLRTVKS